MWIIYKVTNSVLKTTFESFQVNNSNSDWKDLINCEITIKINASLSLSPHWPSIPLPAQRRGTVQECVTELCYWINLLEGVKAQWWQD